MNLVIVESPAKAKTINKYLGDNYKVLASYGHIRDLPSKNGSVDPDQDFKMEWEIDSFSKKYLKEITDAAKDSTKIVQTIQEGLGSIRDLILGGYFSSYVDRYQKSDISLNSKYASKLLYLEHQKQRQV